MGNPIVPAPDVGEPTDFTDAELAAMIGQVVPTTSTILGYTDNSTHSLNALVELVYVRIGNEVMAQSLAKLEGALSATHRSLDALSNLQGLQNMLSVTSRSTIPFDFTRETQHITYTVNFTFPVPPFPTTTLLTHIDVTDAESYQKAYSILGSAYFRPIDPFFSVMIPGRLSGVSLNVTSSAQMTLTQLSAFNFFRSKMLSSKAIISGLISALTPLTPLLPDGSEDPTTLLAKLKIVYGHLPQNSFSSMRAWVLDGYTSHGSTGSVLQGAFQQEITNAIVAGESLNSSQNASVRNYMFIFEQYYQSATSIIASLNQLMSNIARKLSGG